MTGIRYSVRALFGWRVLENEGELEVGRWKLEVGESMKRESLTALLALCISMLACGQGTPVPATAPPDPSPEPPPPAVTSNQLTIAIEYAVPGLAEAYAATGVTYALAHHSL